MRYQARNAAAAALAAGSLAASVSAQPFSITPVAVTGQTIPGGSGRTYLDFDAPAINSSGQVAFRSLISGGNGVHADIAGAPGGLELRLQEITPVPANIGGGSGLWDGLTSPFIADDGRISFTARYQSPTLGTVIGLYQATSSQVQVIADTGSNMPPRPPGASISLGSGPGTLALTRTGISLMQATLGGGGYGSSDDSGVWVGTPGSFALVAATRIALPGATPLVPSFLGPARLNDNGAVAFMALSDTTVTVGGITQRDGGIWTASGGTVAPVLRVGQPAPDMPAGTLFSGQINPTVSINNAGQLAALGVFRSAPLTVTEGQAIWSGPANHLTVAARTGQDAPDAPSGSKFATLFAPLALAGDGAVGFQATLYNTPPGSLTNQGVWMRNAAGQVSAVALQNFPPPDAPPGVVFGTNYAVAMNGSGHLALLAGLMHFGTTSSAGYGLYVADGFGSLDKVLETGDAVSLGSFGTRTLSSMTFYSETGGQDGQQSPLNDFGQLALLARFTDGSSGIIIVNNVPAPSSAAAFTMALLLARGRRRRV